MVLSQIESEVEVLDQHLREERPSLGFILVHARTLLQLAECMVDMASEHLSSHREVQLVAEYKSELLSPT